MHTDDYNFYLLKDGDKYRARVSLKEKVMDKWLSNVTFNDPVKEFKRKIYLEYRNQELTEGHENNN